MTVVDSERREVVERSIIKGGSSRIVELRRMGIMNIIGLIPRQGITWWGG